MINELVIHLGDTKTGSTSIQKALVRGQVKTPGISILYPTRSNHIALAKTLTLRRRLGQREARFGRLHEAFVQSDADYGIVSAEHFQMVDPLVLQQAIGEYWPDLQDQLRLISYVRPHAGKFLSAFSERIKLGADLDSLEQLFDIMTQSGVLDYTPRFQAWRDTFGDRFTLRAFIRDRMYNSDVVQDFFHTVLNSERFEIADAAPANPSLTVSQLALLRRVQTWAVAMAKGPKGPLFRDAQGVFGRILADHLVQSGIGTDGAKLRMPASLATRFQERFAADAEALDVAFFEGFPFSDALEQSAAVVTAAPQSLRAEDHFDARMIEEVLVFARPLAERMAGNPGDFRKTAVLGGAVTR
ncbi:hypothetical protein [Aquicoccus sp. SU-CL01552]|uniref:hypothetical protein n=1 Tax=Aquicoccus sp. SU-CL01552 TaxID=3127656 RepID=UPI00334082CE